eukprot:4523841-Lingulodinium_polyedra.AAC.1
MSCPLAGAQPLHIAVRDAPHEAAGLGRLQVLLALCPQLRRRAPQHAGHAEDGQGCPRCIAVTVLGE